MLKINVSDLKKLLFQYNILFRFNEIQSEEENLEKESFNTTFCLGSIGATGTVTISPTSFNTTFCLGSILNKPATRNILVKFQYNILFRFNEVSSNLYIAVGLFQYNILFRFNNSLCGFYFRDKRVSIQHSV